MKRTMRIAVIPAVVIVVVVSLFYGISSMVFVETKVSDEEVSFVRLDSFPLNHTEFAVNLKTGDERIFLFRFFGPSWAINYGGECECITWVHKMGGKNPYTVSLHSDGQVGYHTANTVRIIPRDEVSDKFQEGLTRLNSTKERFR